MSKRSYFNVFTASTLLLGAAFGCGRAPETPEIPSEVAAAHSVDYSAASDGEVALLSSEAKYDEFIESSPVAVVKFGAEWCPPCRAFEPDLRKQAGYFAGRGVKFAEVDVDELGAKARDLGVRSIPDVRVYVDGRQYAQIVGYEPHTLANLVESLCEPAPLKPENSNAVEPNATQAPSTDADRALETSASDAQEEKPLEEELWPTE
ncbi:MAG: thioredoxin family protein [Thermoguttaceae bacterium]|nr:thioredoxin family protein [Thermoguttaceae bacterium]